MSYIGEAQIRAGQWNAPLYFNAGKVLTGRSLQITIIRPDGSFVVRPAFIGAGEVFLYDQSMLEAQWAICMIQEGDLPVPGLYTAQIEVEPLLPALEIPQSVFQVGE